jgi:hypothetical protein
LPSLARDLVVVRCDDVRRESLDGGGDRQAIDAPAIGCCALRN